MDPPIRRTIPGRSLTNPPTVLSGRPYKDTIPLTGKEHAEKFGDDRVSLLDVLKKARPHEITTQALEERAELEGTVLVPGDKPLKKFTEDDWYRIREDAFHTPVPPAEIKRREQQSARDQRAQRRSQKQPVAPQSKGIRRSSRQQSKNVTYEASPSDSPSSEDSQDSFVASSGSEDYSPSPRGVKRKRTVTFKATDEEASKPAIRRRRRVLDDSDDEMAEATVSRSRSVTPIPRVKKRSTRRTTVADSDDEMGEPSVSRSRSVTPAPAIKRRKIEGKRKVTLADSDDEME